MFNTKFKPHEPEYWDLLAGGRWPDIEEVAQSVKAWREEKGFKTSWHNVPEKLLLVITELAEAMEAYRHLKEGTLWALSTAAEGSRLKLPAALGDAGAEEQGDWILNFEEEIADTAIRLFDLSASLGIDLQTAIAIKMRKNCTRPEKHGKER